MRSCLAVTYFQGITPWILVNPIGRHWLHKQEIPKRISDNSLQVNPIKVTFIPPELQYTQSDCTSGAPKCGQSGHSFKQALFSRLNCPLLLTMWKPTWIMQKCMVSEKSFCSPCSNISSLWCWQRAVCMENCPSPGGKILAEFFKSRAQDVYSAHWPLEAINH